jgi:hypothetical protein
MPKMSVTPEARRSQSSVLAPAIALVATIATISIAIKVVLRLPGVPYNVAELFLDKASASALVIFSLALLWIGGGAMMLARWLAQSRYPYFVLPLGAFVLAMVSRTLLKYSVTYESLNDILGSSTLFRDITLNKIWGEYWSHMFSAANLPSLVEFFERRIRYTAFYSLLAVTLTLMLMPIAVARENRKPNLFPMLALAASAFICLWLAKMVAIDGANTDNLKELIADRSLFGLDGELFVYAIMVLMAANVALLLRASDSRLGWIGALVGSGIAVPLGWWLLNAGLEQHVHKYGKVFSGAQFLLGPDRQHSLSELILFLRWAVVQTGGTGVMFIGAWIGNRLVVAKRYRSIFAIIVIVAVMAEAVWLTFWDIRGGI